VSTGGVVLVGVDGTNSGQAALQVAAQQAAEHGFRLVAVHVRRDPLPIECLGWATDPFGPQWRDVLELEAWLHCTLLLGDLPLDWEFVVADGKPAETLRAHAMGRAARAVYVGTRIRTRWAARLHHCPASDLARRCPCAVRVVQFPAPFG
jgi:nucleotide-binding universal stress UspA family protein